MSFPHFIMPLPRTRNIGTIVRFLKREKPRMSKKQRVAIAISQARKSGANIARKGRRKRK